MRQSRHKVQFSLLPSGIERQGVLHAFFSSHQRPSSAKGCSLRQALIELPFHVLHSQSFPLSSFFSHDEAHAYEMRQSLQQHASCCSKAKRQHRVRCC